MARIAVAIVAIPAILWIAYQGGIWLRTLVIGLALIAAWEMLSQSGFKPNGGWFYLGMGTILLLLIIGTNGIGQLNPDYNLTLLSFGLLIGFFMLSAMLSSIGKRPPAELYSRHATLVWAVCYIGLLYPYVYKVGTEFETVSGGDLLLFLFALVWAGDTAAMGFGKWLGKHKLAPSVSPNKTVEGFLGHILFCLAIGIAAHYLLLTQVTLPLVLGAAVGVSILGQLGDLVESMWKRSIGIKDSSALIPGHGGVLDRFDSLLFGAPFLFFYLRIFVE
ncbi:MAG: phosphatidate cytidylyltransferase [bacterium]|nr:phosphatidate cytidylyltransferase [bacterium]